MKRCAVLSSDAMFRYALWREWDKGFPQILFIGLNPSTADAEYDDPTILRCIGFARQWGYGRLAIANLFAFRSTLPTNLKRCDDPVGVDNNKWLETLSRESQQVVAAWGMHGGFRGRDRDVLSILSVPLLCLGLTKAGYPRHPLYMRRGTALQAFTA